MNEAWASTLRGTRNLLQRGLEPIDWVSRKLNNKGIFPPLWLRQHVGDLRDFEGSCGEYVAYLKLLCNLIPGDKFLDIGCGCGLITYNTTGAGNIFNYLGPQGKYVGIDIDKKAINWCIGHLGGKHNNYLFQHIKGSPEEYIFPFEARSFDVVLCKSLFTHMLPKEIDNYLQQIRRLLKLRGYCLATFFFLGREQESSYYKFSNMGNGVGYIRPSRPRLGVAYREDYLFETIRKLGFSEVSKYYGTWSGQQGGLSFQDLVIIRK